MSSPSITRISPTMLADSAFSGVGNASRAFLYSDRAAV